MIQWQARSHPSFLQRMETYQQARDFDCSCLEVLALTVYQYSKQSLNPCSHLVFALSAAGYALRWDIRTMSCLWETRVSPCRVYSFGGLDGMLRFLNQNTGDVI
ncbi:unnamed protein product [Malus baccata var. baccata]